MTQQRSRSAYSIFTFVHAIIHKTAKFAAFQFVCSVIHDTVKFAA